MFKKIISVLLVCTLLFSLTVFAYSANLSDTQRRFSITNPYNDVSELLGNTDCHYKTNLHTHSTVSDGRVSMPVMIKTYYEQNFDILAMTEHGVVGKKWNEEPTHYFLMRICSFFNSLADKSDYFTNQFEHLTDAEFKAVTEGTYEFDSDKNFVPSTTIPFSEEPSRTYGRGLNCLTGGAEMSAASVLESHVNSYFSSWGECYSGLLTHEGDYEYFVKNIDKDGGLSVINHPGHYLNSKFIPENAEDEDQLFYFSSIFNKYDSCLGIETFNNNDNESINNRLFWDRLLDYVIPYGKRNVYGFSNSDAHEQKSVDTEFMDFILPAFTDNNFRIAMEKGAFFATGRRAKNASELGDGFKASGPVPRVVGITVDDDNDIITVKLKNAKRIEWVSSGKVIETQTESAGDCLVSQIKLCDYGDDITCYVRFQAFGDGGYCYSNPFICDDGNMSRFVIEDNRNSVHKTVDSVDRFLTGNILGALIKILSWWIEKQRY